MCGLQVARSGLARPIAVPGYDMLVGQELKDKFDFPCKSEGLRFHLAAALACAHLGCRLTSQLKAQVPTSLS